MYMLSFGVVGRVWLRLFLPKTIENGRRNRHNVGSGAENVSSGAPWARLWGRGGSGGVRGPFFNDF